MSTAVYIQQPTIGNRPMARKDAQGNIIPSTFQDLAYQADFLAGAVPVYQGYARPGSDVDNPVWKIQFNTYDVDGNLTSTTWPQDANAHASSDYQFVWSDHTDLTYS